MRGKRSSEHKYSGFTVVMIIVWIFTLAAITVLNQGCASYARTPAPIPPQSVLKPIAITYELSEGPDDTLMKTVTVRSMRIALVTAERYEGAVAEQNAAVNQAEEFYARYAEASGFVIDNAKAGLWNSFLAASVGIFGGTLIGFLLTIGR